MSQKVNAKNLSYVASPPPFLAALQAQVAGCGGPDPVAASSSRRRAVKKRSGSEEAEDIPLVVDDNGNTVALSVDRNGVVVSVTTEGQQDDRGHDSRDEAVTDKEDGAGPKGPLAPESETSSSLWKREVGGQTSIGGRNKRKVGRAITSEADTVMKITSSESRVAPPTENDLLDNAENSRNVGVTKKPKRAKKIKLSFDQD